MKLSIFLAGVIALLVIALTIAAAPLIGLGQGGDFLFFQLVGVRRGLAFAYALALVFLLCTYQALSIGIAATPKLPKWRAVMQSVWIAGTTQLIGQPTASVRIKQWQQIAILVVVFAVAFAIFLSKNRLAFEQEFDQVWYQAFVDYDVDWRTPIFSFAGNVLNNFGIQLPLKTQLLPILGLSQFFAHDQHIPAAVALFFIAMAALFWVIGAAWGIPPVSRAVFAGLVALITTVPRGLDLIFWPLPSNFNFLSSNFVFELWWQEAVILFLATVVFFYWIGQRKSLVTNIFYGVGFTLGCFLAVLGYPVGSIYFVPLIGLYCLAFFCTSVTRAEWMWKASVSAAVVAAMLAFKVPQFFANLYSYSFGGYFVDLLRAPVLLSFKSTFIVTRGEGDLRGVVIYILSMATVAVVAYQGTTALRRFAIAVLVCEITTIAIGSVNALIFKVPMTLAFAEKATSPLWSAYLVLACMAVAVAIDRRLAMLPTSVSDRGALSLLFVIKNRHTIYASALAAVLFAIAILLPPQQGIPHPHPAQPSIVQLLEREVAVTPGAPFRGRALVIMPGDSDLYVDLLPFGIPTVNERQHWTSPLTFAFLRAFFGHETDSIDKGLFLLTAYDPKIARLMGVRMVVTDTELFDGVLLHQEKWENSDLRIYRLGDVNLGQFSPTRPARVATAAEAVAALKATSFDPQRDVVVEGELPIDLVPAGPVSVTVEAGPQLHIRATSHGHSLVVLPFEFSHCLRLHAAAGSRAYLLPVNLQQTGLIFDDKIEVNIEYRYGLFGKAQCRGADVDRANTLRLRELVSAPKR